MRSADIWLRVLAFAALAAALPAAGARAQDAGNGAETVARAWGALIFAGEGDVETLPAGENDARFKAVRAKLEKAFPYSNYRLIAQHTQKIFKEYESWVVPSKELFLKVDSRGPAEGGGTRLDVQVWHDDKVLLKTTAVLKPDQPLFIAGPDWRGGKLIFAVMLL